MATFVIYADAADGYINCNSSNYTTARGGGGTITANTGNVATYVGQYFSSPTSYVYEAFLSFDTSGVTGVPGTATLSVYTQSTDGATFTINARAVDWGATLTTADFVAGASLSGNPLRASRSTASWPLEQYVDFTSDVSFVSNLTSPVRLLLSSSLTESASAPSGPESVSWYPADNTGTTKDPKLTIVTDIVTAKSGSDTASGTDSSTGVGITRAIDPVPAIVTDAFSDTAGTLLESHLPSRYTWTRVGGTSGVTLKIGSDGRAYVENTNIGAPGSVDYSLDIPISAATDFSADIVLGSGTTWQNQIAWLLSRWNGIRGAGSTYYGLDIATDTTSVSFSLYKVLTGSATQLGSTYTITSAAAGDTITLRFVQSGSSISVYVNGTLRISATDSAIASGIVGFEGSYSTNNSTSGRGLLFDNLSVTADGLTTLGMETGAGTDSATAPTDPSNIAKTASDTGTGTDATSRLLANVPTRNPTGTRAAYGSPVTIFAGGTIGTNQAHCAFPCAVTLPDGSILAACRRGTSHVSHDGSIVGRIKAPGGSWGSEFVIKSGGSVGGYTPDWRDVDLRLLADGRVALSMSVATSPPGGDLYRPGVSFLPAGADPSVSANWSAPVYPSFPTIQPTWGVACCTIDLPNGDLLCAAYGTPTLPWTKNVCEISRLPAGSSTWVPLSVLDDGSAHALSSSGEPQLIYLGGSRVLGIYRTIASPWETWARLSTNLGASWGSEYRIATSSVNRTGAAKMAEGDIIIAFGNFTTLQFEQSFDEGATFGSPQTPGGSVRVWASPFPIGTPGTTPSAAIVYAYENETQDQASTYYQELTALTTGGVSLADTATGSDSASVVVGVGAIAKTASDSGTATDSRSLAVTVTRTASDIGTGFDSSGSSTVPSVITYTRPFLAPLDVFDGSAPLDVFDGSAPLDMTYTEAT